MHECINLLAPLESKGNGCTWWKFTRKDHTTTKHNAKLTNEKQSKGWKIWYVPMELKT